MPQSAERERQHLFWLHQNFVTAREPGNSRPVHQVAALLGRGWHAMKAQQVQAGGGDQNGEFLDEFLGVEQEVGGAIPSGMRKLVHQLAVGTFG